MADSKERYSAYQASVPVEEELRVGRKARSAVHAEEGGEYESVVNGSLARGWVDWRG
ncbi:hypothetical protein K443DRAFT_686702 [Laccaria amethystina LaAM-08-1]|uniref:Uncharacterized protein n=1 Tax=Laccaria amethystina LaAM-08-1 TaxID=1095629 RepID=A0A0C9WH47_9AGAR|nr:hypothetical protein K443DRAFT_686702 [Laccaria amethystina LaAM-08-1]